MTGPAPIPVPVDAVELVLSVLRPLQAARPEPVLAGLKVSTETGHGSQGGPPSMPWLRITEDGHTWRWPAVQRVVLRLTYWHRTDHDAKAAAYADRTVHQNPWTAVGVGFGVGMMFGALVTLLASRPTHGVMDQLR